MTRMIALLRGINVGAGNRIRMDALRLLFEQAGFSGVVTYIQSGNVLFSTDAPERSVQDTIQRILLEGAEITQRGGIGRHRVELSVFQC